MVISDWFPKNKLGRLMKSQWIKLFILTSILQLVAVVALESRVLHRNKRLQAELPDRPECKSSRDRMTLIIQENVIFILFQLFQLWFCLNGVFNQNTIQMLALTVINFLCGFYGIVQIFEIRKWTNDLTENCDRRIPKQIFTVDVPLVVVLGLFALIMAVISFALYKEFGWKNYKKIGADIKMQKIYETMLIFVMLLKLDLFFVLLLSIEVFFAFSEDKGIQAPGKIDFTFKLPKGLYYFHLAITIMIFFLEVVAYRSIKKEWKEGMITYLALSTIVVIDFALILRSALSTVKSSWFFFICFLSVAIILCMVTWAYAIRVYRNFGLGLKEVLSKDKQNKQNNTNIDDDPEIGSSTQAGNAEKFVID